MVLRISDLFLWVSVDSCEKESAGELRQVVLTYQLFVLILGTIIQHTVII